MLVLLYITLKHLGVIGRQFADGTNTQVQFSVTNVGQVFEVPINRDRRGIYRYKARLVFGESDFAPSKAYQDASFSFEEKFCENGTAIGKSFLNIEVEPNIAKHSGMGRYGALIQTPLLQKERKVCLEVKIDELSTPVFDDLKLNVWVGNTRPCWGIECMLD